MLQVLILWTMLCMVATPLFAQTGLTRKQAEIHKRKAQLEDCLSQVQSKQAELHRIEAKYEELKRDHRDKEDKRSQAKDAYTRASRNVDIITPEQLSKLLAEYQEAEKKSKEKQGVRPTHLTKLA